MTTKADKGINTDGIIPDERLVEVLEVVCENVGGDWAELAGCLGLSQSDVKCIRKQSDPSVPQGQCWEALCKWRTKTPKNKIIRDLCHALLQCRQKRVADLVHKLMETPHSVNHILSPHLDREEKMLEAMYTIVDMEAIHWRNISTHLGLSDKDIIHIQHQFGARTREKCMHALYKWRHMVPLHQYKVANLVMALRAGGLAHVAGLVKNLGTQHTMKIKERQHCQDEIFIHLQVDDVDIETYTPTPNSTPRGDPTPRPKNSLPREMLNSYILNKVFFHLLDQLESQEKDGTHPLVMYLQEECHGSEISEVNRRCGYIAVKAKSRRDVQTLHEAVHSGSINSVLTDTLVTEVINREIGLTQAKLCASLH